jgi:hypothetical protein
VENCFILSSLGNGISVTSCDDFSLDGVVCNKNIGKGIELISGNTNVIITAVGCSGNGSDGIKLTATSDDCVIGNSVLSSNGGYGINIAASSCDNNIIRNNIYNGNSSGDINDSGTDTKKDIDFLSLTGTKIVQSADTERIKYARDGYTLVKDIITAKSGVVNVYFEMKAIVNSTAYGRIYVNDVAVGTEQSTSSLTYVAYNEDISVNIGDNVQLYYKVTT